LPRLHGRASWFRMPSMVLREGRQFRLTDVHGHIVRGILA
jgi:hypothetical protein